MCAHAWNSLYPKLGAGDTVALKDRLCGRSSALPPWETRPVPEAPGLWPRWPQLSREQRASPLRWLCALRLRSGRGRTRPSSRRVAPPWLLGVSFHQLPEVTLCHSYRQPEWPPSGVHAGLGRPQGPCSPAPSGSTQPGTLVRVTRGFSRSARQDNAGPAPAPRDGAQGTTGHRCGRPRPVGIWGRSVRGFQLLLMVRVSAFPLAVTE